MNTTLTALGIALLVALMTALLGPFFVDWNQHRAFFEHHASEMLGMPVHVQGKIDARLLPQPEVRFTDVVIGDADGPLSLHAAGFGFDLSLMPLMRGEITVDELHLNRPKIVATLGKDGALVLPADVKEHPAADLARVSLDHVEVSDGSVDLRDERTGRRLELASIAAIGSAESLSGPFRIEGTAHGGGAPYAFRVQAGSFAQGAGHIKLSAHPDGENHRLFDLDGTLALANAQPRFTGKALLESRAAKHEDAATAPMPWRITAEVKADPATVALEKVELQSGTTERALTLAGSGTIDLGAKPAATLNLAARQLDLDRALGRGPDDPALPVLDVLTGVAARFSGMADPPLPLRVEAKLDGITAGRDIVQDVTLALESGQGAWTIQDLSARLPGNAMLKASGSLPRESFPAFSGHVTLDAPNLPNLVHWLGGAEGTAPDTAAKHLVLSGDLDARPDAVGLSGANITADGTTLTGSGHWRRKTKDAPASLGAVLTADTLDLDRLDAKRVLRLIGVSGKARKTDIDIALNAKTLVFHGIEAHGVALDMGARKGVLDLRKASIADLDGGKLDLHGRLDLHGEGDHGRITANLDAPRAEGVLALLDELPLPERVLAGLHARAAGLAPAKLSASIGSAEDGQGYTGKIEGTLGGVHLAADGRASRLDAEGEGSVSLQAEAQDGADLLRALGWNPGPLARLEPARLSLEASGKLADASVKADWDGEAAVHFDGTLKGWDENNGLSGRLTAKAPDVPALAVRLGRVAPGSLPAFPFDLSAKLDAGPNGLRLSAVTAQLGDDTLTGDLALGAGGAITGDLAVDRLALRDLAALGLGPAALDAQAGQSWPDTAFAPGLLAGLDANVSVQARTLDLADGFSAQDARFTLALHDRDLAVRNASASFAGGTLGGGFALSGSGDATALNGTVSLKDVALDALAGAASGAQGRIDLALDVQGRGSSLKQIVGALTGGGSVTFHDLSLPRLDPASFRTVFDAEESDALEADPAKVRRAFQAALEKGPLTLSEVTGAVGIASGVARVVNAAVTSDAADASASLSLDLNVWTASGELDLRPKALPDVADADRPSVRVSLSGPLAAPARSLDTASLTAFLASRSIARQTTKMEQLEAERRQRAEAAREAAKAAADKAAADAAARKAAAAQKRAQEEAVRRAAAAAVAPPLDLMPGALYVPPGATSRRTPPRSINDLLQQ